MKDSKPVKFTRHAKNRMRWRKIRREDVKFSISKPMLVKKAELGEVNAWIKLSDQFLRTTYREEADKIIVISAVLKKNLPEE